MKAIGILPGPRAALIDHIVPLCSLLQIPLVVTEPEIKELIELYYPPIEVRLEQPEDYCLDAALEDFDLFVYVHFARTGRKTFFFNEYVCHKQARSVISLHGNPDKFHDIYWLENLADEDIVLAYGSQLLELMRDKGIEKEPIICGNYRLTYYHANKEFFDAKLPFKKEKKTILYAPTWASANLTMAQRKYYTPFSEVYKEVFEQLPQSYQLICKFHPIHCLTMGDELEQIKESYPHILFVDNFPLVYPLLNQIDIFLGDYSSIGYDFLYFDRPLFFLTPGPKTPLHSAGICIEKETYKTIEHNLEAPLQKKRQQLYQKAYREPNEAFQKEIFRCV